MIQLPSDRRGTGRYGAATSGHMAGAVQALEELCAELSSNEVDPSSRPIHVKLGHYEHGAFLSTDLRVFALATVTSRTEVLPRLQDDGSQGSRLATVLLTPKASSASVPFVVAVVANHPIEVQVESVLAHLASLVARQGVSDRVTRDRDTTDLDLKIKGLDDETLQGVSGVLHARGWRGAAQAIRRRAEAAGLPLKVRYEAPLLSPEEVRLRVPVLRKVYNDSILIRQSVDKVAALTSQPAQARSTGGSDQVLRFADDLLDLTSARTFLAHVTRDAFVCGNGALAWGEIPDTDMRLIRPERMTVIRPGLAMDEDKMSSGHVMHLRGAEQWNAAHGVSLLEPFVHHIDMLEIYQDVLRDAEIILRRPDAPVEARTWAGKTIPMARRQLALVESQIERVLGFATSRMELADPEQLYFAGHTKMTPEQCLKPVDHAEGPYPPGDLEAMRQDRRANAGREGTTRAHRSSWSCRGR